MATYKELRGLFNHSDLLERVEVAVIVAANNLADTPTNNAWVAVAFSSPNSEAKKALMGVIAANADKTLTEIDEVGDVALQNKVNAVVNTLAAAMAGA